MFIKKEGIKMHETRMIKPVIQGVIQHAEREGAKEITKLRLKVGEMIGTNQESFTKTFKTLAEDTMLEDTELELTFFPGSGVEVVSFDVDQQE